MDGPTRENVLMLLRWFKEGPPGAIPIEHEGRSLGSLQACTWEEAGDPTILARLAEWHESAFTRFPESRPVTPDAVRAWLVQQVMPTPDRVLFWVKDPRGVCVGHLGISRIDPDAGTGYLCDLVAMNPAAERLLQHAISTLQYWLQTTLSVEFVSEPRRRAA